MSIHVITEEEHKKNDYMKSFEAYIKFIESYGGKIPIHPASLKPSLSNMGFMDAENPTKEENEQS